MVISTVVFYFYFIKAILLEAGTKTGWRGKIPSTPPMENMASWNLHRQMCSVCLLGDFRCWASSRARAGHRSRATLCIAGFAVVFVGVVDAGWILLPSPQNEERNGQENDMRGISGTERATYLGVGHLDGLKRRR